MPSTEFSVLDYARTAGGPALFMSAVLGVAMPLLWARVVRRRWARWPARSAAMLTCWGLAFLVAYGDVYWIAWHTRRHCEGEAGLRVFRTVSVPAAGDFGAVESWFTARARFVAEHVSAGRTYMSVRGPWTDPARPPVYEYRSQDGPVPGRLWRTRHAIRELASGAELAVLTVFRPGYGWLDRALSALVGVPWGCRGPGLEELPLAYELLLGAVFQPAAAGGAAP